MNLEEIRKEIENIVSDAIMNMLRDKGYILMTKQEAAHRILSIEIGGEVVVKRSTCDKNCNEYDYAECPGNDGECIMQKGTRPRLLKEALMEAIE